MSRRWMNLQPKCRNSAGRSVCPRPLCRRWATSPSVRIRKTTCSPFGKRMNTQSRNEYLLIFRGNVWDKDLSPEELQKVVTQWASWFEGLIQEGKCKTGQPLEREGKVVSGKKKTVSDGPFAESKETI